MYEPQEDSEFLSGILKKVIKKYNPETFLDMGCGSCIQSRTAIKAGIKKPDILAVDISEKALKQAEKLEIKAKKSNLFSKIKKQEKFDLIVFNPPYLPEDEHDKGKDTTGGKHGYETIQRFLKNAKKHLTNKGKILLLFSSLTKPEKIKQILKKYKYKYKKLAEKNLFMEKLYIHLIENLR